MKVLCYTPYWVWYVHGLFEGTVALALQRDGAQVDSILCDGVYPICDHDTPGTPRQPPTSCNVCQVKQASHIAALPLRYRWMGRFLTPADEREVADWGAALRDEDLETASFDGAPVNQWIRTSVHRTYRLNALELGNPAVNQAFRKYLMTAALTQRGIGRAIDYHEPDLMLLFNGHRATTRVALEVARARGVRVLCHERGLRRGTFTLFDGDHCMTSEVYRDLWKAWGHVPLTVSEIRQAVTYMEERTTGKALNWIQYSPSPRGTGDVYAKLGLDPDKRLWSLYTSSTDEMVGLPEYRLAAAQQESWVLDTLDFAAAHPEMQLVVRAHPNSVANNVVTHRAEREFIDHIERRLPPNARLIKGRDDISTYDIVEASDLGLVFNSTTGVEMACRGIEVVFTGNGRYAGLPFLDTAMGRGAYTLKYEEALEKPRGVRSWNRQRFAYRFAHAWIYRWLVDFPLLEMPSHAEARLRYTSTEDLAPGKDAALDRIRRIIYDREPVASLPGEEHLARSDQDELAFFRDGLLSGVEAAAD